MEVPRQQAASTLPHLRQNTSIRFHASWWREHRRQEKLLWGFQNRARIIVHVNETAQARGTSTSILRVLTRGATTSAPAAGGIDAYRLSGFESPAGSKVSASVSLAEVSVGCFVCPLIC